MTSETIKRKPVGLIICGIFFIILGLLSFTVQLNELRDIATKDQLVKIMEDLLDRAEKTQDFKPSTLQKEFVKALKEYKVSTVDYVFKIISLVSAIMLFIIAIAIFTNKRWTILAVNLYIFFTILEELIENAIFTFVKPMPTPATLDLSHNQKVFLYIQNFIPILLIALLILWYFNRRKIKEFFVN